MTKNNTFYFLAITIIISVLLLYFGVTAFVDSQLLGKNARYRYFPEYKSDPYTTLYVDFNLDSNNILELNLKNLSVKFSESQDMCLESIFIFVDSPLYLVPDDKLRVGISGFDHAHYFGGPFDSTFEEVQFQELCDHKNVAHEVYFRETKYIESPVDAISIHKYNDPINNLRKYPYDIYFASVAVVIKAVSSEGDEVWIAPNIILDFPLGVLKSTVSINDMASPQVYNIPDIPIATVIDIELTRSVGIKYLTLIILLTLFGLIISIVLVQSIDNALQIAMVIILGLWGVQDILVPQTITEPTFTRPAIIFLYFLFGIAMLTRFITLKLYQKYKGFSNDR